MYYQKFNNICSNISITSLPCWYHCCRQIFHGNNGLNHSSINTTLTHYGSYRTVVPFDPHAKYNNLYYIIHKIDDRVHTTKSMQTVPCHASVLCSCHFWLKTLKLILWILWYRLLYFAWADQRVQQFYNYHNVSRRYL